MQLFLLLLLQLFALFLSSLAGSNIRIDLPINLLFLNSIDKVDCIVATVLQHAQLESVIRNICAPKMGERTQDYHLRVRNTMNDLLSQGDGKDKMKIISPGILSRWTDELEQFNAGDFSHKCLVFIRLQRYYDPLIICSQDLVSNQEINKGIINGDNLVWLMKRHKVSLHLISPKTPFSQMEYMFDSASAMHYEWVRTPIHIPIFNHMKEKLLVAVLNLGHDQRSQLKNGINDAYKGNVDEYYNRASSIIKEEIERNGGLSTEIDSSSNFVIKLIGRLRGPIVFIPQRDYEPLVIRGGPLSFVDFKDGYNLPLQWVATEDELTFEIESHEQPRRNQHDQLEKKFPFILKWSEFCTTKELSGKGNPWSCTAL